MNDFTLPMPVGASTKMSAPNRVSESNSKDWEGTHREPQPLQFPAASLCSLHDRRLENVSVSRHAAIAGTDSW
jgi:hypothetical protein